MREDEEEDSVVAMVWELAEEVGVWGGCEEGMRERGAAAARERPAPVELVSLQFTGTVRGGIFVTLCERVMVRTFVKVSLSKFSYHNYIVRQ